MGLLHGVIMVGFAWRLFKKSGQHFARTFWLAFVFKLLMGAALGLVYHYYYSANDTWLFFNDANAAADFAKADFLAYLKFLFTDEVPSSLADQLVNNQERSLFLIKFMSIFSWLGGNNYWISAAYFSLISFAASWYLFLSVTRSFENSEVAASLSFLFFPSIVFWSSGLVKETLALAGIYFIAGLFIRYIHHQKIKWFEWLIALYSFWVAWNLKYYWTALFAAVMLAYVIVFFLSKKYSTIQKHEAIGGLIMFILLCGAASFLHPNFHLNRFLEVLITNHDDFIKISSDDGLIHFYNLHASWASVILNSPWALFSGLLRPFVWEVSGMAAIFASLENSVIAILLISAMSGFRMKSPHRLLLFSTIMYIALLCVFLGLSTPNLGTLSRYRVGFLPFLIFIISYRNPWLDYVRIKMRINSW
jgi:hypothetical protein